MKCISDLDLNGNEIKKPILEKASVAPSNPREGQVYFDSVNKIYKYWDGTSWLPYEKNIIIGTEAERLALNSAPNGILFHQIDPSTGLIRRYLRENNVWRETLDIVTHNYEEVIIMLTSSDRNINFDEYHITVVNGLNTKQISLDVNGVCSFNITNGEQYTIQYPSITDYDKPADETYYASQSVRMLTHKYMRQTVTVDGNATNVTLESLSPDWTRGGSFEAVGRCIAPSSYLDGSGVEQALSNSNYGTFVIDEAHLAYARLSPQNHNFFDDGTVWSGNYGNAFRRLPRIYFICQDGKLYISDKKISNNYWEEDWIGTYKGAVVNNILLSRPNLASTNSKTMTAFWECAQRLGLDYGLVNYFDQQKLIALHLAAFGKANSEATMGPGLQSAGSSYYSTTSGSTAELGDGTGDMPYLSTSYRMNKLFGIENLAGSSWEFRPNIYFNGSIANVYEGNIVSESAPASRTFTRNLTSAPQAYVTHMELGEFFDIIPKSVNGSSSTYWCDGTWAASTGVILLVGGASDVGAIAGLACSYSYYVFSCSISSIGARLAFKGDITKYNFVSGADLRTLNS